MSYRYSDVSAVRAPISLGIGPAEEFKMSVQLVGDISFNGMFVWDYGTMSYKYYLTIDSIADPAVSVP